MDETKAGIAEKINMYKSDVEVLVKFLPWLEKKNGENIHNTYVSENSVAEHAMKVPVYDSTLMSFIKAARNTKFINRNYVYTYSRKRIKTAEDEKKVIKQCDIMDIQIIGDILSYYCIKGMIKGHIWTDGVQNGVYYELVKKLKELIEYWTVPMNR